MQTEAPKQLRKPTNFDELYPGRFMKAGELLDQKHTLVIAAVDLEELVGEAGEKKVKAIVSFEKTQKKLVACKTNGICLKAMFGPKVQDWVGKRVTLFPSEWNGEPCIRVWGSPEIPRDFEVEVALPRRRPFKMRMTRVLPKGATTQQAPRQPAPQQAERDAEPDFPEPGSGG